MIQIWNWFNGKKTVIGAACLFLAMFIEQILIPKWGVSVAWIGSLRDTFIWIGGILTPAGLIHKGVKQMESKTE